MSLGRVLLTVAVLAVAAPAGAQTCTSDQGALQQARQLFVEGSADVDSGRWADAIEKFERAYSLSCAPSALYNLAMALRALGRHREARDAFDRLLANHPNLTGELQANTTMYRREEAARVAVLELAGVDPDVRPEISLDGRSVPDQGARPIVIETDSGAHSLVLQVPSFQPFLWEGSLADGQRQSVQVSLAPLPEGAGEFEYWPILVAIAGVLVAGAAIGVGVYLWDEAQIDPYHPDGVVTLE
jgi:tetratricopeptide (TPR) repeat protein